MSFLKRFLEIKLNWVDLALTKIAVFFAALFIVKLWPGIVSLDIGWYLLIWILAAVKPFLTLVKEMKS